METDGFPGFQQFVLQGLQYLQYLGVQPRVPDTADKSYTFVKYSLARLGTRRQARIGREFDKQGGTIAPGTIPNGFEPLGKLARYLLPHLRFEQLNFSNEQDYKIFFSSLSVAFGYK